MPVSIRDDYPAGCANGNSCYACSCSRTGELVVDLGVSIDMEGYACLCASCGLEIGKLLGLVEPDAAVEAVAAMHALQATADGLLAERNEALALVAALRRHDEQHPAEPPAPVLCEHDDAEEVRAAFEAGEKGTTTVKPPPKPKAAPRKRAPKPKAAQ